MIHKSVQLTEEKTLEIYYEEPMEGVLHLRTKVVNSKNTMRENEQKTEKRK